MDMLDRVDWNDIFNEYLIILIEIAYFNIELWTEKMGYFYGVWINLVNVLSLLHELGMWQDHNNVV